MGRGKGTRPPCPSASSLPLASFCRNCYRPAITIPWMRGLQRYVESSLQPLTCLPAGPIERHITLRRGTAQLLGPFRPPVATGFAPVGPAAELGGPRPAPAGDLAGRDVEAGIGPVRLGLNLARHPWHQAAKLSRRSAAAWISSSVSHGRRTARISSPRSSSCHARRLSACLGRRDGSSHGDALRWPTSPSGLFPVIRWN